MAGGRPIGNNSDLYPRWIGARAVLLEHRNPYSAEVTREIQIGYYGRPLDPVRAADPVDQQGFAYPLYVVFLLAPVVNVPFATLSPVFGWLLLACTACSVPLWMYATGIRASPLTRLAFVILTLGTYPVVQGFYKQQFSLLVGLLLAAATAAAERHWLVLAGFLAALAMIKPQISVLLILWLVAWTFGDWSRRKRFVISFLLTMAVLVGGAEILLPGWISLFAASLREYQHYAADPSILQVLFTSTGGNVIAAIVLLYFALLCMAERFYKRESEPPGSVGFAWMVALSLTATLAVLPKLAAYNQILLIPAVFVLARHRHDAHKWKMLQRSMTRGTFACIVWQWTAALLLSLASFVVPLAKLRWSAEVPLYTLFAMPLLALAAIMLSSPGFLGLTFYSAKAVKK